MLAIQARPAVLLLALLATPALAQVADPAPDIPSGVRAVTVETVVTLPDSGSVSPGLSPLVFPWRQLDSYKGKVNYETIGRLKVKLAGV